MAKREDGEKNFLREAADRGEDGSVSPPGSGDFVEFAAHCHSETLQTAESLPDCSDVAGKHCDGLQDPQVIVFYERLLLAQES